ncbi:MAG: shikimate dehydrogenase [Verrucomicrobia bacterium]|nr:shikimate dehydrogenase [Verrucomicrobiota bacterium]MDA1067407.1 shikimate dehydrogenase [Verrucomicrobiota bacterium]
MNPIFKNDLSSDSVYSIEDLNTWPSSGISLAVVGHPVKHTLSPPMHNAAIEALAESNERFKNWRYYKFDIEPTRLQEALPKFHARGFLGINLTVPHKILATQFVSIGEKEVKLTGACNTLLKTEKGYTGFNTDLYGMTQAIETQFSIHLKDREVILLGAGGAARAAAIACAQAGVKKLTLANRTLSKLDTIIESLEKLEDPPKVKTCQLPGNLPFDSDELLVINATSLGLKPNDPAPADLSQLPSSTLVFDMIYNPAQTALLKQAQAQGMRTSNGIGMLVFQGERSLKIWSNTNPSPAIMLKAVQAGLDSF